jgi:putative ABC transport system permease protein
VLFVSASAFGMYLKQVAEQSVVDVDYDICFVTEDMDEDEMFRIYDELQTADGVSGSSYQTIMTYSCATRASDFSERYREFAGYDSPDETDSLSMDIQFIEDSEYLRFLEGLGLPVEEYTGENAKMTAVAKANLYDEEAEENALFDMFADRSMTFSVTPETGDKKTAKQGQDIDVTFVDTIPLDTLPRESSAPKSTVFMVVAPYQLKDRFEVPGEKEEHGLTFLSKNPSQSAAQMEAMIQAAGVTSEYTLHKVYAILEQNRNIIFVVDVFTYVFIIMISLIATANVFNTISTNIKLRRRELAMLRSEGMSDRDFQKMMNFECAFYGMRTLLFGLPIAGILSWLIYRGLFSGGADIAFTFPWSSISISVLGVFVVVFITMLYAVSKIRKENIIDALRDDMT